uniref:NADH-ubiquinone oxidoreductase chain 5 n=1 Tax=Planocera multitentaculata TaxID=31247 RepID=A0A5S9KFA4_9PLAT|nr:NADH dehydrogenase subunit 5 [Planocera multitentaculata]
MLEYNVKYNFPYTCSNLFFFLSIIFFCLFLISDNSYLITINILDINSVSLDLSFFVDWISLLFFSVLCTIVSCVLKFSCIYMEYDSFNERFTWIVISFVFSMFCLIFFPHFFFLLVGWDGLGITSFLLVIYYLSDSSWAAGMKTYLINRVGDSFFIIGLVLFLHNGYWDINSVSNNWLLGLIIVLGCFTKSAQFPFSSWLPAAMAAPTPVSALVHSSTLVTAGIYLMIRFSSIFPDWLFLIIGLSGMWTLYSASLAACCEYDGKKVVAYSTLSQLGLMGVAISLNLPLIAFFHLITHAMFKALIFICVGYLINNSGHFQDLRSLNGLWSSSPLLSITLIVSSLSLLGFPFFAGFFSKELILENNISIMNNVFQYLLIISLPLTSYYSTRLLFNILNGCNYNSVTSTNDENILFFSLLPLYLGSIGIGCILYPKFYSLSSILPCHWMKVIVLILVFFGVCLSWNDVKINNNSFIWFNSTIGFLVPFNSSFWNNSLSNTGSNLFYLLDQGGLSRILFSLDNGINSKGSWINSSIAYFSSPNVKYYIGGLLGICVLGGTIS